MVSYLRLIDYHLRTVFETMHETKPTRLSCLRFASRATGGWFFEIDLQVAKQYAYNAKNNHTVWNMHEFAQWTGMLYELSSPSPLIVTRWYGSSEDN